MFLKSSYRFQCNVLKYRIVVIMNEVQIGVQNTEARRYDLDILAHHLSRDLLGYIHCILPPVNDFTP